MKKGERLLSLLGVGQTRYYFTTGRKLAAGAGIAPAFTPSKGAVLRLDDPAIRNGARGRIRTRTGDALDVVSLLVGLREQNEMEPPAGDAPTRFLYKRNPQAAAWRRNGRGPQCCPGHSGRMKPA